MAIKLSIFALVFVVGLFFWFGGESELETPLEVEQSSDTQKELSITIAKKEISKPKQYTTSNAKKELSGVAALKESIVAKERAYQEYRETQTHLKQQRAVKYAQYRTRLDQIHRGGVKSRYKEQMRAKNEVHKKTYLSKSMSEGRIKQQNYFKHTKEVMMRTKTMQLMQHKQELSQKYKRGE